MVQTGVIILAHGRRGERGIVEVPEVLRRVTSGVKPFLSPEVAVVGAAFQFNHHDLEEAEGLKQVKSEGVTRTAAAIRHLCTRRNSAVLAIGNAPMALQALLDLIDGAEIKPALVVGMPVGFVQAGNLRKN